MNEITVQIKKDGNGYVSHCLDYDIASQGHSREEAKDNIVEAVSLFLELASPEEIARRLERRGLVEQIQVGSA